MPPEADWVPPRALLVSASGGVRVPHDDLRALAAATALVERSMQREAAVPEGRILAVEVTVRYSAKARGRARAA